ncbi:MCE family protein [Nocardia bovistercoris]|uniref:MCE family protein n=1 Tax=Nocardia bovistercoris TaxID=2785916 RepID=A0A931IBD3_9NOCA|nr:MCE family protein [Nocardia bovistercoris]MBH0778482.1 MCE family protein [Nocardia bovistercoris]
MTPKIVTARRPLEEYRTWVVGVVALVLLIAVVAAALGVNRLGVGTVKYEVEFAQAAGLSPGDSVTVAGVPVGTVTAQRLAGDHVVATLTVQDDVALGAETRASIKLTTLLGARYVELKPAGKGSVPDRRITLSHSAVPYDLQQALDNATVTFDQIDAGQISRSLNTLATQLDGVPSVLPGLLENLRALSTIVGDRRGELGALLAGAQRLTTVVTEQRADLSAIMTQGRDLLTEIVARRDAIQRLMSATNELAGQIRDLVGTDRPQVDELLNGLNGLLGSLARNDELLRNTLQILPIPIRNFTNASGTGNEVDFTSPNGVLIDSWMCAISSRAKQANLTPYFEDCR